MRIEHSTSQVLVVDIQEKLAPHLQQGEALVHNAEKVLKVAKWLNIPVTFAEQYPKGLGKTVAPLQQFITDNLFTKTSFSCFGEPALRAHLAARNNQRQLIVIGCEAHVCVLQTVLDALAENYQVFVVNDAVSSRKHEDKALAQARLSQLGAVYVSAEMLLFEWAKTKECSEFKRISALVK